MRHIRLYLFFILAIIISFLSCNPDDDTFVDLGDDRDKFLGTWSVSESCFKTNYTVTISKDPSHSAQILLLNFGNPGPDYNATVGLVAGNKIFVASQIIGDDWTVSGTATLLEPNLMSWAYSLVIAGNSLDCSADYDR
ncbi:MAG: hypothetical protein GY834_12460 [Bacteroidetes bacterium]|nr:hypothetical protein [Bacteroidota bacterium]